MADILVNTTIQHRHDYSYNWTEKNPVLEQGEIGVEIDTCKAKVGNGSTKWSDLPYLTGGISKEEILELFYPIGSIKFSVNSDNPGLTIGGVWERWGQGRIPLSVNEDIEAYAESEMTGGEAEHVLTLEEIPAHTHGVVMPIGETVSSLKYNGQKSGIDPETHTFETTSAGGDMAHNNMPPYITCYMWKRVG